MSSTLKKIHWTCSVECWPNSSCMKSDFHISTSPLVSLISHSCLFLPLRLNYWESCELNFKQRFPPQKRLLAKISWKLFVWNYYYCIIILWIKDTYCRGVKLISFSKAEKHSWQEMAHGARSDVMKEFASLSTQWPHIGIFFSNLGTH